MREKMFVLDPAQETIEMSVTRRSPSGSYSWGTRSDCKNGRGKDIGYRERALAKRMSPGEGMAGCGQQ